jgi:glycosyltransferase involved in cell wall biosynthesis
VRLLIATEHLGVVGGVETHLRAVLPRLAALGHELALLYATPAAGPTILDGVPGVPAWPTLAAATEWRPDVVYSHGLPDPAAEAELAARFPTVLFAHNYHGTCVSGTKCHARRGYRPCTRRLGLGCLAAYLPLGCGGRSPLTAVRLYRRERRRRAAMGRYRAVLVAGRHMRAEFARHGVPADRLHVVPLFPPGVEPDPHPPAPRPRTDRVLLVGRLTAPKGAGVAAGAVARAAADLGRRLTLAVAGDGPDRPRLEADCRRLGVPAEFLGWVEADRRTNEMRSADVLLVPSVWPEPFGLVGIEAGCVGLPAAAFAAGGVPDWLDPGVSGELAPADPPAAAGLAAAVVRAVAADSHRHRLAAGAWEAAGRFTPAAHLARLGAVLGAAAGG